MDHEKVEAFTKRILQECAQEGLTISEALRVPQELKFSLDKMISEYKNCTKFKLP